MIKFDTKQHHTDIVEALKAGDEQQLSSALEAFGESVKEKVLADAAEISESADAAVLAQRGYRQLTTQEKKWYQKAIAALKSENPKQAFNAIIGSENEEDLMPSTIIEDVYRNLKENHPILGAINFQYVGYMTKWILNDHSVQKAVWGPLNSEIVKEITSAFKTIDITQSKLAAYAVIENDMLDLGPTFLDGYIRTVLAEAMACGMEAGICSGSGVNGEPIGTMTD